MLFFFLWSWLLINVRFGLINFACSNKSIEESLLSLNDTESRHKYLFHLWSSQLIRTYKYETWSRPSVVTGPPPPPPWCHNCSPFLSWQVWSSVWSPVWSLGRTGCRPWTTPWTWWATPVGRSPRQNSSTLSAQVSGESMGKVVQELNWTRMLTCCRFSSQFRIWRTLLHAFHRPRL